jgi:hypothetical protein
MLRRIYKTSMIIQLISSIDPMEKIEEDKPKATLISKKKERKKSTKSSTSSPAKKSALVGEEITSIGINMEKTSSGSSGGAFQTGAVVKPRKVSTKKEDTLTVKKSGKRKSEPSAEGTPKKKQKKDDTTDKGKKAAATSTKGSASSSSSLKPLSSSVKAEMDIFKKKASERITMIL